MGVDTGGGAAGDAARALGMMMPAPMFPGAGPETGPGGRTCGAAATDDAPGGAGGGVTGMREAAV